MIIKFYYVACISETDTPAFTSQDNQYNYFESKLITSIDSTYYPPHYTNKIKLSIDDIDLNTKINYLSFEYQNHTYYYFIESIKYINENVFEISIKMDTIQTYMFYMNNLKGFLERATISRYNTDGTINRNYFRENITNGIYKNVLTEYYNNYQFAVVRTTKKLIPLGDYQFYDSNGNVIISKDTLDSYYRLPTIEYGDDTKISTFIYTYLLPLHTYYVSIGNTKLYVKEGDNLKRYYIDGFGLYTIYEDTSIIDIQLINNDALSGNGLKIVNDGDLFPILKLNIDLVVPLINFTSVSSFIYLRKAKIISYKVKELDYGFVKNTELNKPFDIKYNPLLIDENYIKLTFGEVNNYSEYPLHLTSKPSINLYMCLDVVNNTRYYNLGYYSIYNNEYNTLVNTHTSNELPLISNAWQEYQARNSATLSFGNAIGVINSTLKSSVGLFEGKYAKGAIGATTSLVGGITNIVEKKENLKHTPNTLLSSTSGFSNTYTKVNAPCLNYKVATDITECTMYFERFGYKVNYYVDNNLSNYTPRYYYNYVQFSNVDLSLIVLNDNETLNNIKTRFINGIRLWSIEKDNVILGDYTYDNVEIENLKENGSDNNGGNTTI